MKSEKGIALIASLLVMAVIMTLGVGAFSLSMMNSKIAENTRSASIAKAEAETGITATVLALEVYYNTHKKFPKSTSSKKFDGFAIPTINGEPAFDDDGNDYEYVPNGDWSGYTLTVKGDTDSKGLHRSEVLVGTSSSVQFPKGFVSEGVVKLNGNFETVNAGIHGNLGFELGGNATYRYCTQTCSDLTGNDRPVTAQVQPNFPDPPINYTCSTRGNGSDGLCSGSAPVNKVDKVIVGIPPYGSMRNDAVNDTDGDGVQDPGEKAVIFGLTSAISSTSSGFPSVGCTHTVTSSDSLATTYPLGSKVCVEPRPQAGDVVTFPSNANYSGVTMIVKDDVTISNSGGNLTDFNLVSMGTLKLGGNANLTNSRLFADTAVDINGSFRYNGTTTVASGGTLNVNGNIDYTGASTDTDIGLALISVGDMSVSGNSQTSGQPLRAALWSGRKMMLNGNTRLIGGAASVGSTDAIDLDINGNSYVDGRGTFTNGDLNSTLTPVILSQR